MPRYPALLLACLSLHTTSGAAADVDVRAYPELAPDRLLPPIVGELRRVLKDPYSIRDFVLCPATKVKLKDGRPVRWSVLFSYNAKNSFGGYVGTQMYAAVFRDGRISGGLVATTLPGNEGLSGLVNQAVGRRMATCPVVPDATIQQLVSPGASPFQAP